MFLFKIITIGPSQRHKTGNGHFRHFSKHTVTSRKNLTDGGQSVASDV